LASSAILAATILAFGALSCQAGEVLDRIMKDGVIRMPVQSEWEPFSFTDASGNLTGFDYEVAREIARRMGVDIQFVTNPDGSKIVWKDQTDGTKWNNNFDFVAASMTPTSKRAEHIAFPVTYYYTLAALCVNSANTSINIPADASGKRIGVQKAATYESYLRREPFGIEGIGEVAYKIDNPEIVTYDNASLPFDDLAEGDGVKLDAVISYLPAIMAEIKKGRPFKIVGQPLFYVPQSIAIQPGDPELADQMTKIVNAMHEDGTLTALSVKWLGIDLTKR